MHFGSLGFEIVAGNCALMVVVGMQGTHPDGNLQNVSVGEHIAWWGFDGNMAPWFEGHICVMSSVVEVCAIFADC